MGNVNSFSQMNLEKKINQDKCVLCEKFAASIWQNWLKNLLLRILSCQFYEKVLFCIQDTLKGANIVPICREQSSNRVPSHIFYPNMPFFLKRFICHIFIFHVCPYAVFFLFLLSAFFFHVCCCTVFCSTFFYIFVSIFSRFDNSYRVQYEIFYRNVNPDFHVKFKFLRSPFRRTVLPAFRARFSLDLKNWAWIWGRNQSIADKNSFMENHLDAIIQSIDSWSCDQCNVEKSIANDIEDSIEKQVHAKLIRDRGMWLTSDLLQPPPAWVRCNLHLSKHASILLFFFNPKTNC